MKICYTLRMGLAYDSRHWICFTIFYAERTGVIQPFLSVFARLIGFPRVTKCCCRSFHDPLRSGHVIGQDHVVVPTQSWRKEMFHQRWDGALLLSLVYIKQMSGYWTLTTCFGHVALLQADINLHERHMLDLNLEPKSGLKNDVERRRVENVDVTYQSS